MAVRLRPRLSVLVFRDQRRGLRIFKHKVLWTASVPHHHRGCEGGPISVNDAKDLMDVLDSLKADYADLQIKESMPLIDYETSRVHGAHVPCEQPEGGLLGGDCDWPNFGGEGFLKEDAWKWWQSSWRWCC